MKIRVYLYILFIGLILFSLNASFANADRLNTAMVKLNRMTPNTVLTGTICATPSDGATGIEDKVSVEFPTDFNIDSNPASWNVDTSEILDNSVAWPGVGLTAISITNRTVTFSSNNLTNSSYLYCFNFASNTSTTGNLGNKTGTITTKNAANVQIDYQEYGLSILNNDQVNITANINPKPSDFNVKLMRINPAGAGVVVAENKEITFQITHGSILTFAYPFTLEASWDKGTPIGENEAFLDLLQYVSGSASNAYGTTPPVIDTVNRKITWTINSFPANTIDEVVTFKLRTTGNFQEPRKAIYRVASRIIFEHGYTVNSYVYDEYKHTLIPEVTPSPIPASPTVVILPKFDSIEIPEIYQDHARIYVSTNLKTEKVVRYGKSINNLNQRTSTNLNKSTHITLDDLSKNTKYYFRVYATDKDGKQVVSDVYTFTTASASSPLLANESSLIATSNNTIISSLNPDNKRFLVLPKNTVFQFKFAMSNQDSANTVGAYLKNDAVLGAYSAPVISAQNSTSLNLIEIERGIYSGNLKTGEENGSYGLYLAINDKNGNLVEQKLAEIKVVDKFTVLSKKNKSPIEGARVYLYLFNPTTKIYNAIPTNAISSGNPLYTNPNGQLDLVLPQGKYKAEISDLRHEKKTIEFQIGPGKNQEFPKVELTEAKITIPGLFNYFRMGINDVFLKNTRAYSETLTGSSRFFDLTALLSLAVLVIITLVAFSRRHHVPLLHIPSYFYYLLDRNDKNSKYIHGVIYDEDDLPIKSANVYLMDKADERIISHKKSNKYGEFFFKKGKSEYLIMAMAKGFSTSPVFQYQEKAHLKFKISLKKEEEGLHLIGRLFNYLSLVTGLGFEVLLILSLILELLFLNSFGVAKTLPFLAITILNLILWMLHLQSKNQIKVSE